MREEADFALLIDAVCSPDSAEDSAVTLYESDATIVYKTSGPEPYVVRLSFQQPEDRAGQVKLLQTIGDLGGLTAAILHSESREIDGRTCAIDVMTYLPGAPLQRYPSRSEAQAIIDAVYRLHRRLRSFSLDAAALGIPSLEEILRGLIASSEPSPMRSRATRLMENKRFSALLANGDSCLLYGDPWPSNFLIDRALQVPQVRIVDIDPLFFGPSILQPALLFSACFVASSLLFPSEDAEVPDLDALIRAWPEHLNREDLLLMMRVFPVVLSLFKRAEHTGSSTYPESLQASLRLQERCLAIIDGYDAA